MILDRLAKRWRRVSAEEDADDRGGCGRGCFSLQLADDGCCLIGCLTYALAGFGLAAFGFLLRRRCTV